MKNYEKYADEIKKYKGDNFCKDFVKPHILKSNDCRNMDCDACSMLQMLWLLEEYKEPEEPETDWSKVEVDTPILVRKSEDEGWRKRYFAKYKNGVTYAWNGGGTSWSVNIITKWKYAKLAESEETK